MQDQDFAIASLLLQDQQRLIAAGKVQRWDVVKWTTAVNLALATASVTVLVALGGGALAYHYHRRINGAWRDADRVAAYFREAGIDFSKIIPGYRAPEMYDAEELSIFGSIIVASILPALLAWLVSMAS